MTISLYVYSLKSNRTCTFIPGMLCTYIDTRTVVVKRKFGTHVSPSLRKELNTRLKYYVGITGPL